MMWENDNVCETVKTCCENDEMLMWWIMWWAENKLYNVYERWMALGVLVVRNQCNFAQDEYFDVNSGK